MNATEEMMVAEALQQLREGDMQRKYDMSVTIGSPESVSTYAPSVRSPTMLTSPVPELESSFDSPPAARGRPSMFGNVLLAATSMLLPAETQKKLRLLVRTLRLANESLSNKVQNLKEAMDAESAGIEPKLSANALRQDVVATVRKSTNLIANFAGNSLPERAKFAVRRCLLDLPAQWAQRNSTHPTPESAVLSLANETIHLIRDVIAIVDDTLDRAESWCGRLGRRSSTDSDVAPGLAPALSTDSINLNTPMTPH